MSIRELIKLPEVIILSFLFAVGLAFFMLTDPRRIPPVVLILGFVLLAAMIYSFMRLVFTILGLKSRMSGKYYAGLLAASTALPVMLLMMQSIGQLTIRDVLTLLILFVVGGFYLSRFRSDG